MSKTLDQFSKTYAFRIKCMLAGGHIETKEQQILLALPPPARPIKVSLEKQKNQSLEETGA